MANELSNGVEIPEELVAGFDVVNKAKRGQLALESENEVRKPSFSREGYSQSNIALRQWLGELMNRFNKR